MNKLGIIAAAALSTLVATSALAAGQIIGVSWSNFQEERWKIDEAAMVAAIEAAATVTEQQAASTPDAGQSGIARLGGPAVAVAPEDAGIGIFGRAVAEQAVGPVQFAGVDIGFATIAGGIDQKRWICFADQVDQRISLSVIHICTGNRAIAD